MNGRSLMAGVGPHQPDIPRAAVERVTQTDADGTKVCSEFWLGRRLVGRAWWDEGRPTRVTSLRRRKAHGLQIEYVDGRVSYVEPFVNGLQHGWARQYDSNGQLLLESRFVKGTGVDFWCNDDGTLAEEHPLVRGKPSGVERWWSSPNAVYDEQHWLDGSWHGPHRMWRDEELLRGFPKFFIRGERVTKREYLRAVRVDATLPAYRRDDDACARSLPEAFVALRARVARRRR